jgi:hypothetical protein
MLSAADIKAKQDRRIEPVDVPEWANEKGEKTVFVRTMTGHQRDVIESDLRQGRHIRGKIAAFTVCTEDGTLLFTEKDAVWLGEKNYRALDRILPVALAVNEMTAEAIDELKKTLKEMTSDDSSSDSQDTTGVLTPQS